MYTLAKWNIWHFRSFAAVLSGLSIRQPWPLRNSSQTIPMVYHLRSSWYTWLMQPGSGTFIGAAWFVGTNQWEAINILAKFWSPHRSYVTPPSTFVCLAVMVLLSFGSLFLVVHALAAPTSTTSCNLSNARLSLPPDQSTLVEPRVAPSFKY